MASPSIPHSRPSIGPAEIAAVTRVLESGQIAQGREVAAFEEECAAFLGRGHAVAVGGGTAAIHLALVALGVGPGDVVAIPSYACAALAQAAAWEGATPLPCDVGADHNLDPARVPRGAAVAIVPHLFGARATLPEGVPVVEDIAQSFGGPTGRGPAVAVTSFYATKMMTTGEGGMIFTDDPGMAELLRDLRDYDNRDDFRVRRACKMTDFQAAMGRAQLRRLPEFVARRAEIARQYHEGLVGLPLDRPALEDRVHFRYVIQTERRGELEAWLRQRGIGACRPVHHPAHRDFGGACPMADAAHARNLSLPIYPELATAAVSIVIESVARFFEESAPSR